MRRHLPRLLLTGALLSPVTLYALGLGEIRLNSALNQPFDADIELISPTPDELAGLDVGLASQELFARYGLDRPAYLSGFDFAISRTPDGRASIKVTSNRSVTEPFVTLLVEASWARGRLLREYTVLLDPPVFMPSQPEAPAPVASPQSGARTEGVIERPAPQAEPSQPEPVAEQAPAATPAAPDEPSAPATTAQPSIGGEYTVERNDTLWRIANSVNPSAVNKTMIALFRANPAAFDDNINLLRAGSVLRIPDIAEIEAVSSGEASAEVARQAAEWSGSAPAQTAEESSRLRLVTPAETPAAPTAAAPATPEQAATETPSSASAAPQTDDRRLEVASPELAAAQRNVDEAPAEPAQAPVEQAAEPVAEAPVAEEPAQQEPVRSESPAQAPAAAPVEPAGPTLAERISQFWWVLVVLGLLVIIGLVVAVVRRRREAEAAESSLSSLGSLRFEPPHERTPAAAPVRARAETLFDEPAEPEVEESFDEPSPITVVRAPAPTRPIEPVEAVTAPKAADDTLSSETAVRFDQQDALAEADFHMAYGLYDQAADLVKIAIEREPARRDLKLKLLEIYFVWGNKDLFLETARDLHATRSEAPAGEWDKVLIMGKQIAADDAMFQGAASGGLDLVDVNLEGGENRVDVDLFAEPDADKPAGLDLEFASGERQGPQAESNSDLDFLLDEPSRGADEEPTREVDPLARTQETPTIESPMLDRSEQTVRERQPERTAAFNNKSNAEATAELSLDDLGLDVNALDHSGSLEDTTSLEKDTIETDVLDRNNLGDDEMTQLAPSLGPLDRTIETPRPQHAAADKADTGTFAAKFDVESTGTIFIDQVDLSGGDTVEQARPDVDATASMKAAPLDVDFDHLSGSQAAPGDTQEQPHPGDADRFSMDVFADRTAESPRIDLDVGESLGNEDREPTNRQITTEMELSELEPVTMSEVGTKLDLARAYMDMGDPDGARSILEEVLTEGDPGQKQEAQRLLEAVR